MSVYESEFCVVDTVNPTGWWFIGHAWESYNSPEWPSSEALIADLEAILAALRERS